MGYAMPGPPVPTPAPAPPRNRRWLLVAAGVVVALAGGTLFVAAGMRLSDGVESLAPAPGGCETVLDFDGAGTYTFFVETTGQLDALEGDCAGDEREYDYDGDALPRVNLTLVDEAGEEVDLDRVEGPSYVAAGRRGQAVRTAELAAGGTYILTVDTDEVELVVRVGKDPNRGVAPMRLAGLALVALGLIGAVAALLVRRGATAAPAAPVAATPVWQPGGGPPPVAPPNAGTPVHPPYGGGQPGIGGQWGVPPPSIGSPPPPPPPPPRR